MSFDIQIKGELDGKDIEAGVKELEIKKTLFSTYLKIIFHDNIQTKEDK